jgi:peptidase inhibitor family I36
MRNKRMSVLGRLSILCAAVALAVGAAGPVYASSGTAGSAASITPHSTYADCPSTYFCAYDKYGDMCKWQDNSRDWFSECSWADDFYPKYVYNHGTSGTGVTIYEATNYGDPIGSCVTKGKKVTLAGTYFIGSHQWNC